MTTNTDPRDIIDNSAMTTLQIIIVFISVCLNAMDGFDVLVISVAANGIAAEWDMTRAGLGFVLTSELVGMGIGSLLLGGMADKVGRRVTLLSCLTVMVIGMLLATTATNPYWLSIWRVITGLGIGGMLSCNNATVAEFSNAKRRALCVSLMVIGYPLGGVIVSLMAETLLAPGGPGWRSLFYIGAGITGMLIPAVYFLVPESVHWLARKQPENALDRVNASLRKLGHMVVSSLPEMDTDTQKKSVMDIFSSDLIKITVLVTLAYSLHMVTFYFILKWTPVIVGDLGFNPGLASGVLTWANVGAVLGGLTFGVLTTRVGLKRLTIIILIGSALGVVVFGQTPTDSETLDTMKWLAAFAGFFGNAGVSGLYSIVAYAFPTHVRATGTGFVIGVGRVGAVSSPVIAGYLLQYGTSLSNLGIIMGIGSILSVMALLTVKINDKSAD